MSQKLTLDRLEMILDVVILGVNREAALSDPFDLKVELFLSLLDESTSDLLQQAEEDGLADLALSVFSVEDGGDVNQAARVEAQLEAAREGVAWGEGCVVRRV